MNPAVQAALLRLDPIDDREAYAALAAILASERAPTLESLTEASVRKPDGGFWRSSQQ